MLSESDVVKILAARRLGMRYSEIAEHFPVSERTIRYICTGLLWKRLGLNPVTGIRNPARPWKTTEASIREMRRMRSEGKLLREIAEIFGVCVPYVSEICSGKHWGHIS
jgi:predicted transcriptional regulator